MARPVIGNRVYIEYSKFHTPFDFLAMPLSRRRLPKRLYFIFHCAYLYLFISRRFDNIFLAGHYYSLLPANVTYITDFGFLEESLLLAALFCHFLHKCGRYI